MWSQPKQPWILFIGEKEARLYETSLEGVMLRGTFTRLQEKKELHQILSSKPEAPIRVLIESSSLQYSSSPLPPLIFWDRYLHLKHRQELLGADVKLKNITLHKNYVLESYLKPSHWIEGWLFELSAPESISFLSNEIQGYCTFLNPGVKQCPWMYLGTFEEGYVRQVIFNEGRILSARLIKLPQGLSDSEAREFIAKDTKQAIAYLKKQGTSLPEKLQGFSVLPYECSEFDLTPFPSNNDAILSFIQWWSQQKPQLNLASLKFQAPNPSKIRIGLTATATLMASFFLYDIAYNLNEVYDFQNEAKALEIQKGQLIFLREKLEDEVADYDIPLMKSILEKYEALQKQTHLPLEYLAKMAAVMEDNPEIHIGDFHWENNERDKVVKLILHVNTSEEDERDTISALFRDFRISLDTHFGRDNVTTQKAPFNAAETGIFSGSTHADEAQKDNHEKSGILEVKWAW